MATGHVKWFNRRKGFGFITQGGHEDIFVHYSQIKGGGDQQILHQGDAVEFELCRGPNGPHAVEVRRLVRPHPHGPESRPRYESR